MEAPVLILADAAQVQGEKLFVLGGAWRYIHASQFPVMHSMAIALSIEVPWMETNQRHMFALEVRREDGNAVLADIKGEFETGRPGGIPAGADQQFLLAFPVTLPIDQPGQYVVRVLLDGREANRVPFMVIDRSGKPGSPSGS